MANKWLREINSTLTGVGTGLPFAAKCIAMFLRYCLGYSNPVESIGSNAGIGDSIVVVAGVVTLTDSSASFDSSDVGRSIVVAGCTNPGNDGTFTISTYLSRTQIQFSNASAVNETSLFSWAITISPTLSFWSADKSGTNGEFNAGGTDENFKDTVAGSFVPGDVGKWLVVAGNNKNSGIYLIIACISASEITVDFRSAATEYPDHETGLSWWIITESSSPVRSGDYFQLTTPHVNGWSLEVKIINTDNQRIEVKVSPDGAWGISIGPACWGSYNSKACWFYLAADIDGESLAMMLHQATDNRNNGCLICNLTPYDSGHIDTEKVVLCGNTGTTIATVDGDNFNRGYSVNAAGHGYWYRDWSSAVRNVYMVQTTYSGYANGLEKWTSREKNRRRSGSGSGNGDSFSVAGTTVTLTDAGAAFVSSDVGKTIKIDGATTASHNGLFVITSRISSTQITYENVLAPPSEAFAGNWAIAEFQDLLVGTTMIRDESNMALEFELIGRLKGHYSVRASIGNRVAFNDDAPHALDKFHFASGFAFDWMGITPQH